MLFDVGTKFSITQTPVAGCYCLTNMYPPPPPRSAHDLSPTVVHSLVDTLVKIVAAQEYAAKERRRQAARSTQLADDCVNLDIGAPPTPALFRGIVINQSIDSACSMQHACSGGGESQPAAGHVA